MRELLRARLESDKDILEEMMPPSWHVFEKTAAYISSVHSHRCAGPRATVDTGTAVAGSHLPEDIGTPLSGEGTMPPTSDPNVDRWCGYHPRIQRCKGRLIYVVSQMGKPSIWYEHPNFILLYGIFLE